MQNRYIGDVGDFGKYGLLRYLVGLFDHDQRLKLGVLWYLVPDESHNNDGAKTQYLFQSDPEPFERCDPDLYRALRAVVLTGKRSVAALQTSSVLPTDTVFADEALCFRLNGKREAPANRMARRHRWVEAGHRITVDCDIVFADPDNGLECASVRPWDRNGPKYTFTSELAPIIDRGQSLVVYHHTCRKGTAEAQVRSTLRMLQQLRKSQPAFALLFRRGSSRAFLILPAPEHENVLKRRVRSMVASFWSNHFTLISSHKR